MATRRDDWLSRLEQEGPSAPLLKSLLDTSLPKLEARLLALAWLPRDESVGAAAAQFFKKFPVRFREQLGTAAAAAGVAWLHGAKQSAFARLKTPKAPNALVGPWHQRVTAALRVALARRPDSNESATRSAARSLPKGAVHEAWLALAAAHHPDDLPALLERLADGPATEVGERAAELLGFPVDGRIADAAALFVTRPSVRYSAEVSVFTVMALLLAVHGNRAHRGAVELLGAKVPSLLWLERALPDVAAPVVARSSGSGRQASAGPTSDAEFLRFLGEAPADDTRVALYMDWLLERGDPLGTFMSLQRSGRELTPRELRQAAALQKKHQKTWLGSLARGCVKGSASFRRGVLRGVALSCWRPADVPPLDEPWLPLLESLDFNGGTNLPLAEFLTRARWTSLRCLGTYARLLAQTPERLLAQLEGLSIEGDFTASPDLTLAVLQRPLPKLRTLVLRGDWREGREQLAASRVFAQLDFLRVETHRPELWEPLRGKAKQLDLVAAYSGETARRADAR